MALALTITAFASLPIDDSTHTTSALCAVELDDCNQPASAIAPLANVSTAEIDHCTCGVKAGLFDGAQPAGGYTVPGCGKCVSIFVEILNPEKGFCRNVAQCPEGDPDPCKGDLKVTIVTDSMTCCKTAFPEGWRPSWGAGDLLWGATASKTWDGLSAACNSSASKTFTIQLKINSSQSTTISRTAKLMCNQCGDASSDSD